jgi:hypothetical protein
LNREKANLRIFTPQKFSRPMQRSNYPPQNQAYYAQPEQPYQPQPVVYQRPQTYVQA